MYAYPVVGAMYNDPSLRRNRCVKVSFSEQESRLIDAWVGEQQKAAVLRSALLARANLELHRDPQFALFYANYRGHIER
jgi:hypothetical protein